MQGGAPSPLHVFINIPGKINSKKGNNPHSHYNVTQTLWMLYETSENSLFSRSKCVYISVMALRTQMSNYFHA